VIVGRRTVRAFTFVEALVILAVLAALLLLVLPRYHAARQRAQRIRCTSHFKQIGLSMKTWALEHGDGYPFQVSITNGGTMELTTNETVTPHLAVMSNELSTPIVLVCPADPERKPANRFLGPPGPDSIPLSDRHVSYFLGLSAEEERPSVVLGGDRFLGVAGKRVVPGLHHISTNSKVSWVSSWHAGGGQILLSDGSVQQINSVKLQEHLCNGGVPTNTILMP